MGRSIALMATKEEKAFIWKRYSCLVRKDYDSPMSNHDSKPNPFITTNLDREPEIAQTSRTKESDDYYTKAYSHYVPYFDWVSYDEFINILNKLFIQYHAKKNRSLKF